MNFYFISSLFIVMAWTFSTHANANINSFPLSPYQAEYSVEYYGLNAGKSVHTLNLTQNKTYQIESKTIPRFKWIPVHFNERSQFTWENNDIRPLFYNYDLKEARKHKKGTVEFNWAAKQIENRTGQEPYTHPLTLGMQDKLTHALKMRLDLLSDTQKPLHYMVAEDDEVKPYRFNIITKERIRTELGWLDTIKISHTSRSGKRLTFWLAESFEYAPVKVEQAKKGSVFARGEIISYQKL